MAFFLIYNLPSGPFLNINDTHVCKSRLLYAAVYLTLPLDWDMDSQATVAGGRRGRRVA